MSVKSKSRGFTKQRCFHDGQFRFAIFGCTFAPGTCRTLNINQSIQIILEDLCRSIDQLSFSSRARSKAFRCVNSDSTATIDDSPEITFPETEPATQCFCGPRTVGRRDREGACHTSGVVGQHDAVAGACEFRREFTWANRGVAALRQPAKPRGHRPRSSPASNFKRTTVGQTDGEINVTGWVSKPVSGSMLPERMGTPSPSLNTESGVSIPIERRPSRVAYPALTNTHPRSRNLWNMERVPASPPRWIQIRRVDGFRSAMVSLPERSTLARSHRSRAGCCPRRRTILRDLHSGSPSSRLRVTTRGGARRKGAFETKA